MFREVCKDTEYEAEHTGRLIKERKGEERRGEERRGEERSGVEWSGVE